MLEILTADSNTSTCFEKRQEYILVGNAVTNGERFARAVTSTIYQNLFRVILRVRWHDTLHTWAVRRPKRPHVHLDQDNQWFWRIMRLHVAISHRITNDLEIILIAINLQLYYINYISIILLYMYKELLSLCIQEGI